MIQRHTQQPDYWEDFSVTERDIEYLYDLILEREEPGTVEELALSVIQRHCSEEEDRLQERLSRGELFQPRNSYPEGAQLLFPALDYAPATVVGKRPGHSVQYGDFTVIQVKFAHEEELREFASELKADHPLSLRGEEDILAKGYLLSPEELQTAYGAPVAAALEKALARDDDFVHLGREWYLQELMADVHEGHRNIVEAIIDVGGEPLDPERILSQLDLPAQLKRRTQVLSLNYALSHDPRFADVGPTGQPRWFLRRMEPEEAHRKPLWLRSVEEPYDPIVIRADLFPWVREFADELIGSDLQPTWEWEPAETTFVLTYPHRRAGTLPLTPQTGPFFPRREGGAVRITFRDPQSRMRWPGWVAEGRYVYGLGPWYERVVIPAGAYITLRRGADALEVVIECQRRRRREWVRMARARDGRLSFEMQNRLVHCECDDLMLIVEGNSEELDQVWRQTADERRPIFTVLCELFPELSKLNPQGTVHVKTLYAAVNMMRRCPPGPVLAELSTRACFLPMGGGYWGYDERRK